MVFMTQDVAVCGSVEEQLPTNAPGPLGNLVVLTHYFDANNLIHNILDGKAVTGCLHFINKTPIMWYSKKRRAVQKLQCLGQNSLLLEHVLSKLLI